MLESLLFGHLNISHRPGVAITAIGQGRLSVVEDPGVGSGSDCEPDDLAHTDEPVSVSGFIHDPVLFKAVYGRW